MSLPSKNKFLKYEDLATANDFEFARMQLCDAIKLHKAHSIHTKKKESSDRWENVKNVMYEEEKGLLRAYKPYASGRNFRLLMEKVFTKAIKTVALAKMTGTTTLPGILELSVLGGAFFECKRIGEEKSQKRKEILEKQKNDINEAEEDMGLLP